ncbi:MAG: hypothetical protein ABJG88_10420 [Litorimonas sp.]
MSDDIQELTAFGSGKSEAEVAFELLNKLKGQGVWGERNISAILDMYAECLDAARGLRKYEGQNRYDASTTTPSKQAAASASAPSPTPNSAQNPAPAQQQMSAAQAAQIQAQRQQAAQMQQAQAAQQQPVHAQQQAVQQAFKG